MKPVDESDTAWIYERTVPWWWRTVAISGWATANLLDGRHWLLWFPGFAFVVGDLLRALYRFLNPVQTDA